MRTPRAIWLTGLSSTGKSSTAAELRTLLSQRGVVPVLLDGDQLRDALPWPTGYAREERLDLARFYGRLARGFVEQGHLVICSTVSLFHEVHAWNRAHIPGYFEVWLRAPAAELELRDRDRQVYTGARGAVVGRDVVPEFPRAPDLIVENHGATTPTAAARRIIECVDA
ncbi:MAG TPA: adenylyl-sulfate kinase [Conexibacter sp.]|nr:adenylyl-sulfate kinase [Conexibacter sp.]